LRRTLVLFNSIAQLFIISKALGLNF